MGPAELYVPGAMSVPTAYVPSWSMVVRGGGGGAGSASAGPAKAQQLATRKAMVVAPLDRIRYGIINCVAPSIVLPRSTFPHRRQLGAVIGDCGAEELPLLHGGGVPREVVRQECHRLVGRGVE